MCIIGSVVSDECRLLFGLRVQRSGLFWLLLPATVAKHSTDNRWLCSVEPGQSAVVSEHFCVYKGAAGLPQISPELHFQWYHFLMLCKSYRGNRMTVPALKTPSPMIIVNQVFSVQGLETDPNINFMCQFLYSLLSFTHPCDTLGHERDVRIVFIKLCCHLVAECGNNILVYFVHADCERRDFAVTDICFKGCNKPILIFMFK